MIGEDNIGPYGYAEAGYSVALSSIGDKVVIGAPNTNLPICEGAGNVFVYETGAVFIEGPMNITVSLFTGSGPSYISWIIDRMDVQRYDIIYIVGDLNGYEGNDSINVTKTITAMVPYGVYRINADLPYDAYADIYVNDQLIDSIENQTRLTFIAANSQSSLDDDESTSDTMTTTQYNNTTMILSIDFDDRPFDIHWVVVLLNDNSVIDSKNDSTNTITIQRHHRSIVAFGPQSIYGSELMNEHYNETIYITYYSAESKNMLIINDDGRDGLCCTNGNGTIRLYNHNNIMIFKNKVKDTSRFIHRFSIKELLN